MDLLGADQQLGLGALVVRRERDRVEDARLLLAVVAEVGEPAARELTHHPLRARAGVQAAHAHADRPARAGGRRRGDADQRVDLLRLQARDGRRARYGELRLDPRERAQRALAVEHARGDPPREVLDRERLADHHGLDRLGEDLGEARHVRALVRRVEIDRALDVGVVDGLLATVADADDLVDAGHAGLAQREVHRGLRRLDVVREHQIAGTHAVRHKGKLLRS